MTTNLNNSDLVGRDPYCRWITFPEDVSKSSKESTYRKSGLITALSSDFGAFLAGPENRLAEMAVHWILEGIPLASLAYGSDSSFADRDSSSADSALNRNKDRLEKKEGSRRFTGRKEERALHESQLDYVPIQNVPYSLPIVFYGPSGSGKSLLIHGIRRAFTELYPESKILCLTGTDFRRMWLEAARQKMLGELLVHCVEHNIFILEDLQELTDYDETLLDLLSIINDCRRRNTLLIFSCSEYPGKLPLLPALSARLLGGMTIPLVWPSMETRRILLDRALEMNGIMPDPKVFSILLKKLPESAGALLAGVNRIFLQFKAERIAVTAENLEDYFYRLEAKDNCGLDRIAQTTAEYFKISVAELRGQSRRKTVAAARKITIYLGRELAGIKLQDLGSWFSGRNHTTALYSWREIDTGIAVDPELAETVRKIRKILETA